MKRVGLQFCLTVSECVERIRQVAHAHAEPLGSKNPGAPKVKKWACHHEIPQGSLVRNGAEPVKDETVVIIERTFFDFENSAFDQQRTRQWTVQQFSRSLVELMAIGEREVDENFGL